MLSEYVTLENLLEIYEKEIKKKVKNKKRIYKFELYKMEYLLNIKNILLNKKYNGGNYNLFLIYKPKKRLIMSQNMSDKIINHFVARYILEPKLTKHLCSNNAATRKNMGTNYAIKLFKNYIENYKCYEQIYVLKLDISKYFYKIDHEVLKSLIKKELSLDEFSLVSQIIDSTDKDYINNYIRNIQSDDIPKYETGKGLPIGNMTSQFLAIFYLHKLHNYIIQDLQLSHIVIYMDDYVILHDDKEYLKKCLEKIENILYNEYKLELNKNKTYIKNINDGVIFLGYKFMVKEKKTIIKLPSEVKKRLKKQIKQKKYEYDNNIMPFENMFSSIMNYKNSFIFVNKDVTNKIIQKHWY